MHEPPPRDLRGDADSSMSFKVRSIRDLGGPDVTAQLSRDNPKSQIGTFMKASHGTTPTGQLSRTLLGRELWPPDPAVPQKGCGPPRLGPEKSLGTPRGTAG